MFNPRGLPRLSRSWERQHQRGSELPASVAIGPKHWRKRAEEARNVADKMNDPLAKALMLWIAKDYELVAKRARRTGRTSGHKKKRVTHSASRRRKIPFLMATTFDGGEVIPERG
jgi:hypothetical protein